MGWGFVPWTSHAAPRSAQPSLASYSNEQIHADTRCKNIVLNQYQEIAALLQKGRLILLISLRL